MALWSSMLTSRTVRLYTACRYSKIKLSPFLIDSLHSRRFFLWSCKPTSGSVGWMAFSTTDPSLSNIFTGTLSDKATVPCCNGDVCVGVPGVYPVGGHKVLEILSQFGITPAAIVPSAVMIAAITMALGSPLFIYVFPLLILRPFCTRSVEYSTTAANVAWIAQRRLSRRV
ncbi:hypothetical protein BH20PSE1_BH20PSE1_17010 [soil metagenome]